MTRRLTQLIVVCDLFVVALAFCGAYALRYAFGGAITSFSAFLNDWWQMVLIAVIIWPLLYVHMKLDGFRRGWHFPAVLSQLTLAVLLLMTSLFVYAFLRRQYYSRLVLLYFSVLALVGFVMLRYCVRSLFLVRNRSGAARKVVILGNGPVAHELARKISAHPELMLEVEGFLYPEGSEGCSPGTPSAEGVGRQSVTSLGVVDLFRSTRIEELIVALSDITANETRKVIDLCRREGLRVSLIPQWYELYLSRARLVELDGVPMVSLENQSASPLVLLLHRVLDLLVGISLLAVASPIITVISAGLLLKRGQAFKSEARCGQHGEIFRMYRLNIDREHLEGANSFERLMVKLSLTELPQLFNVLLGDMALVGPRPESPERVRHYSDWQRQRLATKPGLTGLAQVHGLRDQHSSEDKARFDLQYMYHRSPLWDLSLLLQTVWTLVVRMVRTESNAFRPHRESPRPVSPFVEVMRADRSQSGAD